MNKSVFTIEKKDSVIGLAVRSYRAFRPGDLITNLSGETRTRCDQHTLHLPSGKHLFDSRFAGYLEHSCQPNTWVDMERLQVYAIRPIQRGDWLSMDYATTEPVLFKQFACACSAPNCRRWITGHSEQINAEGQQYVLSSISSGVSLLVAAR